MATSATQDRLHRHLDSQFRIGGGRPAPTPYRPNYPIDGPYINAQHASYASAPKNGALIDLGIPGWLKVEDALKLYELAYFSTGDVLELGTHQGLSTSILAQALIDAGNGHRLITIDMEQVYIDKAKTELAARHVDAGVDFLCGDAGPFLDRFEAEGRTFGFAFIDHSHAYAPVVKASQSLGLLLSPGTFALYHDYVDGRNTLRRDAGESGQEYGVVAGAQDGLAADMFEFFGCYGCTGLFYRR